MLRVFSSIRKSLINEGKTSRYVRYAVGEIALIMIGIFLALQLNNWNEDRKDRVEEIELLKKLESEIKIEVDKLQIVFEKNTELLNHGLHFMESHLNHEDAMFNVEDYSRLGGYMRAHIHINSLEVALQGDKNSLIDSGSIIGSLRQLKAHLVLLDNFVKYLDHSWNNRMEPFFRESGLATQRFKNYFAYNTDTDPALLDEIDNEVLVNLLASYLPLHHIWTNRLKITLEEMRNTLRLIQEELEDPDI